MSATLSACGLYRWSLDRGVHDMSSESLFAWPLLIGVNPSKADATVDDQTIRKDIGFTTRWGAFGFMKGNVFGYRATDVRELAKVEDPVGRDNDYFLRSMLAECTVVVPCWGNTSKVPPQLRWRFEHVREMMCESEKPVRIFGLTKNGDPLHPLMLGYSTQMKEWQP